MSLFRSEKIAGDAVIRLRGKEPDHGIDDAVVEFQHVQENINLVFGVEFENEDTAREFFECFRVAKSWRIG